MKYLFLVLLIGLSVFACKNKKTLSKNDTKTEVKEEKIAIDSSQIVVNPLEIPDESARILKIVEKDLDEDVFARIQRTPCFGKCATYTLTVYKNGELNYFGKNNVINMGDYTGKVELSVLETLKVKATEMGYFNLDHIYDNKHVTDLPSTITSINNGEEFYTVINRYEGPEELREFELFFDNLFSKVEWKAVPEN